MPNVMDHASAVHPWWSTWLHVACVVWQTSPKAILGLWPLLLRFCHIWILKCGMSSIWLGEINLSIIVSHSIFGRFSCRGLFEPRLSYLKFLFQKCSFKPNKEKLWSWIIGPGGSRETWFMFRSYVYCHLRLLCCQMEWKCWLFSH